MSEAKKRKPNTEYHRKWRAKRLEKGICTRCSKAPSVSNRVSCSTCLGRSTTYNKLRNSLLRDQGVCVMCKEHRPVTAPGADCCFECWLKRTASAQRHAGREGITTELVREVWERERGCCYYLGLDLTPGVNASLEHRIPVAKGGTDTADNLCFVHKNVNSAKSDLDHGEFLSMVRLIAERWPLPRSLEPG